MAASIYTPPPDVAFNQDPIFVTVQTDQISATTANIVISVSGSPTVGETFKVTWPGGEVTFTAATTTADDGLSWPIQAGGETNAVYAARLAEFLRQSEILRDVFTVNYTGTNITLAHPVAEVYALSVTETLSNISVVVTSAVAAPTPPNLVALLEVWSKTSSFNSNKLLLQQHSPYEIEGAKTWINIAPAFAHLKPFLPATASINPATMPAMLQPIASTHLQKYYLRYADKFGTPPVAGALIRTEAEFIAILGGRAGDALSTDFPQLRHNYRRRDHLQFVKPVDEVQPDWVYFMVPRTGVADVAIKIYWSDGTDSNAAPYGTTDAGWNPGQIYLVPSGFMQMDLHNETPPGGTDPAATIVAYDWILDSSGGDWSINVKYEVRCDTPWEHYLLFENGMGGLETVGLRGKAFGSYNATSEEFGTPRQPGWTAAQGDFATFAGEGRPSWDFSTGWYDDDFYLQHLQQLPLANAWLVDVVNRRFLKVIVQAQTLDDVTKDDETLYALSLKVKAGWKDNNFNI